MKGGKTDVVGLALRDNNNLRCIAVTSRSSNEEFDRYHAATDLGCPPKPQNAAPDDISVARVDTENFSIWRSGYDNLPEAKYIPRERSRICLQCRRDRCVRSCSKSLHKVDNKLWEILKQISVQIFLLVVAGAEGLPVHRQVDV